MEEKIRDKNNKILGTIRTNSLGFKEVRNTHNVRLAVYDSQRNESRNEYNVVLTKYDSLISVLHDHISEEKAKSRTNRAFGGNGSAEIERRDVERGTRSLSKRSTAFGKSLSDNLISRLKTISTSDAKKVITSFAKVLHKEFTSVRKGVLFWAGMTLLALVVLLLSVLLVVKLTS